MKCVEFLLYTSKKHERRCWCFQQNRLKYKIFRTFIGDCSCFYKHIELIRPDCHYSSGRNRLSVQKHWAAIRIFSVRSSEAIALRAGSDNITICVRALSKDRRAKYLYNKQERLTASCRVTFTWSEGVNFYSQ
jgi:hypothetical protein